MEQIKNTLTTLLATSFILIGLIGIVMMTINLLGFAFYQDTQA